MYYFIFFTFLCAFFHSSAGQNVLNFEMNVKKSLSNLLKSSASGLDLKELKEVKQLFQQPFEQEFAPVNSLKVRSFSWKDCGSPASLVNIKSFSLTPDPITLPGALFVETHFTVKSALQGQLKAHIELAKKELGMYIRIPCIDDFGSCDYDDLCLLLSTIASQCPDPVKKIGIDCTCPIKPKTYMLPKSEFDITASLIPPGEYHIVANVTQNEKAAACLDIYVEFE